MFQVNELYLKLKALRYGAILNLWSTITDINISVCTVRRIAKWNDGGDAILWATTRRSINLRFSWNGKKRLSRKVLMSASFYLLSIHYIWIVLQKIYVSHRMQCQLPVCNRPTRPVGRDFDWVSLWYNFACDSYKMTFKLLINLIYAAIFI